MREIKFRAWDKDLKGYIIEPCFIGGSKVYVQRGNIITEVVNVEIIQYTGLKDKNGKEIYESDLLKWDDSGDVMEVKWIDASWQIHGNYNTFASHKWEDSQIIGNIYEKSKLLKQL